MLFSPNDTHTHCLVRSVLFLSVPLLSACLDRTFVSRAGGNGILRDGFLGMVGLWDAELIGVGVKQGVLAAKPEELILGAYNTPILLLWLLEEHVEGEEGKTISPFWQGSSPGWGLLSTSSFPSSGLTSPYGGGWEQGKAGC